MFHRQIGSRAYDLVPHRYIGGLAAQIYDLARLAFGAYPGVLVPSHEHRDWYLRRPGMDGDLSTAIVCEGTLVANVFVTVAALRLGGRMLPVGIVDTVMTHPEHCRQGLARWALTTAITGMRERGLSASVLYTVAGSMPYRFYESLGYLPHAPVHYYRALLGGPPVADGCARAMRADEGEAVRQFVDACASRHDGYVPLDDRLWRWRRLERPSTIPATVWLVGAPAALRGCAAVCRASIVTAGGGQARCYVLSDLALAPGADARGVLGALLGTIPPEAEARTLSADSDPALCATLEELGFQRAATETAMVLPLTEQARAGLRGPRRPWYALAESIIGV